VYYNVFISGPGAPGNYVAPSDPPRPVATVIPVVNGNPLQIAGAQPLY